MDEIPDSYLPKPVESEITMSKLMRKHNDLSTLKFTCGSKHATSLQNLHQLQKIR